MVDFLTGLLGCLNKFQMPAFSEMDCDKGSEEQNEYQQLLERNNNLEREIKKMKSDFIVLKQKIICTDTLIKKVQEKHKYCEILERKYSELRKIMDASKREWEVHTKEYQGILLKFGPLKQEKEMFEWRCAQLNEEVEQLKNGIRCHEVVQNQMKEASKKQQQDFENCRKENKLLQNKLNRLKQLRKNSEKKQASSSEKQQKKKNVKKVPKKLVPNRADEEGDISLREMALNIEAQFANGEVTEMHDLRGKPTNAVNGAKRKAPRKNKSTKGKTKKLYTISSVKKAKRRNIKSVQDVGSISRLKGKNKSHSVNKQLEGIAHNVTNSIVGQIDSYPQKSAKSPCAEEEPNDRYSNIDSERRLALLYEDLMISSDDEDQESTCIQNEPSCSLDANNPPPIIVSIPNSDINNSNVNLLNEKDDLISCKEGKNAPEVLMSQETEAKENEESQAAAQIICSSVKEILVDAGITLTSNDSEENQDQTNHLQNHGDLPQLPLDLQESNALSFKVNETVENTNIFVGSCDSRDFHNTTEKSTCCVDVDQLDMEIASKIKEVEILNHAKENRKRKSTNTSLSADHNIPISFKKFEELDIEDVLNLVGIARPLSPLANRNSSLKHLENAKKHDIVDAVDQIPSNHLNLPENSTLTKSVDYVSTKSFLSHSCRGTISNCTLNRNECPQILRDVYYNLSKLVKYNKQPLSPFLFEARNLKISGLPFVRIIMKIIQKSSINVMKFWFENQSLIDTPHDHPWLPPSLMRLVEILVSCSTSLDQGKATLEIFMANSFALIIYYCWGERLTKYKEFFISCLSSCVVAILRIQDFQALAHTIYFGPHRLTTFYRMMIAHCTVVLLQIFRNMERVRMLLYEVIRNSCESSRIGTVAMTICAVWPQCLMLSKVEKHRFSSVQQVLRYYVTTTFKCQDTETRFVKQLCGWEKVEQSPDEVVSKLFQQIEHFFSQDSIGQDVVSRTSWEMQTAVMLLCTKEGWSWTSAMVSRFLWPFLGAWGSGNSTSNDCFVQLVIDLLGICLSQYLEKIDPANYNNIFDNLKLLVMQTSVSLNIRESALRSVLRLSHHSSFPCQLVSFVSQYRSLFSEETHVLLGLFSI